MLFVACGPAPEPEPQDDPINDLKSLGDAFQELGDAIDDSGLGNMGTSCTELDEYETLVDDYVVVLAELAEHGEEDAELMAKKLDLEARADEISKEWEGNPPADPACAARLMSIQLKFTAGIGEAFAGAEGFEDALQGLEELGTAVEEAEAANQ